MLYIFSFLRPYFCFLRSLNSCDNMGYIFPMCVVCTQPTFLTWLVFLYVIANFPLSKYYINIYYWYNMFAVHRVVNGHPQYRSTDTWNTLPRRISQEISFATNLGHFGIWPMYSVLDLKHVPQLLETPFTIY